MRVGILGGTFDPIHLGHLRIAQEALSRLELQRVIFMPAGQPRLRGPEAPSPATHRLRMVELAVADNPDFVACDSEVRRTGPTYTVETLEELQRQLGSNTCLYLIVGIDVLEHFERWKNPERLLELCNLVVVNRPGYEDFEWPAWKARFSLGPDRVTLLSEPQIELSGTEIRRRVAQGSSLRQLVPEPVEEYIKAHELYLAR